MKLPVKKCEVFKTSLLEISIIDSVMDEVNLEG